MDEEQHRYYETIRLVEKEAYELDPARGHQRLNSDLFSGRIQAIVRALQPLHVGTGILVPPAAVDLESDVPLLKAFYQVEGRLTIPGSSLKGPVRSLIEAITYSCIAKSKDRLGPDYDECRYNSKQQRGELCPACRLFGAMGYQGQVSFSDAPLITGQSELWAIPPQYQPKRGPGRRYYPHTLRDSRDRTWPLEVASVDSRFSVEINLQNLSAEETGLLLLALGQGDPPLCLKLGAGKSASLGSVRFEEVIVERLVLADLYRNYESRSAWQPVNTADCLTKAAGLLRKDSALQRLQADLNCNQVKA